MEIVKKKSLLIKGTVLDKYQLERYLESVAVNHILQDHSDKNTYPNFWLIQNLKEINKTYNLLNEQIKLKIPIHPARRVGLR